MAKKRKVHSEDDDSDFSAGESDVSEFEPAAPASKKKNAKRGDAGKRRKRAERGGPAAEASADGQAHRHAASAHVLADPRALRDALLAWYAGVHAARAMPWRKPYDPAATPDARAQRAYEVWVSEVMLQQTQVETVKPYYTKWMARFPTIRDLAAADIETVHGLWKGLGYYSRAARLLDGAQKAVRALGGRLPDNARDMQAQIPGIGRYSAGAICSIAYNECVPVLDGNVHRVLSRVLALHAPPKGKQTLDTLWRAAGALVEGARRPGDLNQALIELGATVCTVRAPACGACPLRGACGALVRQEYATQDGPAPVLQDIEELCTLCAPLPAAAAAVTAYPMKAEKKRAREELDVVSVVEWRRAGGDSERWFLLVRRPQGGLLAGLHEFPTAADVPADTAPADTVHALLAALLASPPVPAPKEDARPAAHAGAENGMEAGAGPESALDVGAAPTVRVARIAPAGDVLHVFSHIRKTYRAQWVLLCGGGTAGGGPPALAQAHAAWTREGDVADANIGTGVLKVWERVRALWADAAGAGADATQTRTRRRPGRRL